METIWVLYSETLDAFHVNNSSLNRIGTVGLRREGDIWRRITARGWNVFYRKTGHETLYKAVLALVQETMPHCKTLLEVGDGRWIVNGVPKPPESPDVEHGPTSSDEDAQASGHNGVVSSFTRKCVSRSGNGTASSRPPKQKRPSAIGRKKVVVPRQPVDVSAPPRKKIVKRSR